MSDTPMPTPALPPILLDAERAAAYIGVSKSLFLKLDRTGELGPMPVKVRRRVLWSRFELEEWVKERLPHRTQWRAGQ